MSADVPQTAVEALAPVLHQRNEYWRGRCVHYSAPGSPIQCKDEAQVILAALPPGWSLVNYRAAEDGRALAELREALWGYVIAQGQMRDRWAEGDDAVKLDLWRALHACEEPARAALSALREQP